MHWISNGWTQVVFMWVVFIFNQIIFQHDVLTFIHAWVLDTFYNPDEEGVSSINDTKTDVIHIYRSPLWTMNKWQDYGNVLQESAEKYSIFCFYMHMEKQ